MTPRLWGHFSIFGLVFFVFKSLLGIARQWSREKFAILTLKPRIQVRTWPWVIAQAPVVQTLDSAIHRINHYPADGETNCTIHWIEIYPVDSTIQHLKNRGQENSVEWNSGEGVSGHHICIPQNSFFRKGTRKGIETFLSIENIHALHMNPCYYSSTIPGIHRQCARANLA